MQKARFRAFLYLIEPNVVLRGNLADNLVVHDDVATFFNVPDRLSVDADLPVPAKESKLAVMDVDGGVAIVKRRDVSDFVIADPNGMAK